MKEVVRLDEEQLDAIKEIGNIGAGHASTALSQMIGDRVEMKVPQVYLVPIEKVPEIVGGPEKIIAGIYMRILGDVQGRVLMTFPEENAMILSDLLLGRDVGTSKGISKEEESALKELANILTGSYLTALSTFLNMSFLPSIPSFSFDMAGAIVDLIVIELSQTVDYALTIETEFIISDRKFNGQFFLLFDSDSFSTILRSIGMTDGRVD